MIKLYNNWKNLRSSDLLFLYTNVNEMIYFFGKIQKVYISNAIHIFESQHK
jgi:hypothetical protein